MQSKAARSCRRPYNLVDSICYTAVQGLVWSKGAGLPQNNIFSTLNLRSTTLVSDKPSNSSKDSNIEITATSRYVQKPTNVKKRLAISTRV